MLRQAVRLSWILVACLVPAMAFAQGAGQPAVAPPVVPPVVRPSPLPPSLKQVPKAGQQPLSPEQSLDQFFPRFCSPPCPGQAPPGVPRSWNSNTIYPIMPWYGVATPNRLNYGTVVGYIEVPPQQVVVDVYVPGPGSFSGGLEPQTVEIPGYVVTETTTGYIYPARVGLRQVTPGVLNWVTEPPGFQPK